MVAHDHSGLHLLQIDLLGQSLGTDAGHLTARRKTIRACIGRTVVGKHHVPVQIRKHPGQRHRIWACPTD